MTSETNAPRYIRRPEVLSRTGLDVRLLYRLLRADKFPKPIKIADRAVAWREDDVSAWIASRPVATYGEAIAA